jgi:DNA-binding MarR family transcriptional regulator
MDELPKRQADVLAEIAAYREKHGCAPALAEVAKALGISEPTVHEHVRALVRKGRLKRGAPGAVRTWAPVT